jgi:hypothetical protein
MALIGIGVAIGSRIAAPRESTPPSTNTTPVTTANERPAASRPTLAQKMPTRERAIAAAAQSITAFDGKVLLEPARLHAVVEHIASAGSRSRLIETFDQASVQTRASLGADTVPHPVIVLRSVPIGYRVEQFSSNRATVAIWYVGIVGSGATVQPQQSWRTQVVSLMWEHGAWKVSSYESSSGPTPPLSTAAVAESPGDLFATIPRFEEFARAEP